jgi:hypothetical protein
MRKGGTTAGKTKVSMRAVIPVLLLVILPVSYFLIFSELEIITTPPEKMFVGEDAFPDGSVKTSYIVRRYEAPNSQWTATTTFSNSSSAIDENAQIMIISCNSTFVAHDQYLGFLRGTNMKLTNISLGDEGFFVSYANLVGPSETAYIFRENNISVIVGFNKEVFEDPYQPWMDEVAGLQASMIR